MDLQQRPSGERIHIGFFGQRNAGKSSLINAIASQRISLVSPVKGTTTDPVKKAMELLPLGPVVLIDTPGLDDDGELGSLRTQRARQTMEQVDLAVVVVNAQIGMTEADEALCRQFREKKTPCLIAITQCDLLDSYPENQDKQIFVSAATGYGIEELKHRLAELPGRTEAPRRLVGDLFETGDLVLLVTPIDESAPKGRLILPQVQTIRDILDSGGICMTVRDTELEAALQCLPKKPKLVITDSQVFGFVQKTIPEDIGLTSFSILFARYKGELSGLVRGCDKLDSLQDGDRVLISEGCTHHRQCRDIGTVKLPHWIADYTGKTLSFDFSSGGDFPDSLSSYALVVHCGGCMLTPKEMQARRESAIKAGIPMTNYGLVIAKIHGILPRALAPLSRKRNNPPFLFTKEILK